MAPRSKHHRVALAAMGLSLIAVLISFSPLVTDSWQRSILAVAGISVLLSSLAALQLNLFREGDAARRNRTHHPETKEVKPAPLSLRNPKLRAIWRHQEETRQLMQKKAERGFAEAALRERSRLGLTEEEQILFMGEPSWLHLWPILLVSAGLLSGSALISQRKGGNATFLLLALGLLGLLLASFFRGRDRYYLTNFRILLCKRRAFGRVPQWKALRYEQIEAWRERRGVLLPLLSVRGEGTQLEIIGLSRDDFNTLTNMLKNRGCPSRD